MFAPYVKEAFLKKLLSEIKKEVSLVLLTRANPYDFVMGASDVSAWDYVWKHRGSVRILNSLHAKYYRFDDIVFIGSANLTSNGFEDFGNFELLKREKFDKQFCEFEEQALDLSVEADLALKLTIEKEIESIDRSSFSKVWDDVTKLRKEINPGWYPHSGASISSGLIEFLRSVMRKKINRERMAAEELLALDDLNALGINESTGNFERVLKQKFRQSPAVARIIELFLITRRPERPYLSFGTIKCSGAFKFETHNANRDVNAIMNWLTEVIPEEFSDEKPQRHTRLISFKPQRSKTPS